MQRRGYTYDTDHVSAIHRDRGTICRVRIDRHSIRDRCCGTVACGGRRFTLRNRALMRWIVPEKRAAIYIRDGFTCCYCGTDLRNASRADIGLDHLISRNHGGSNHATNLSTCCGLCNSTKGTQNYTEYAAGGSLVRIERTRMQPVNIDLGRALIEGYGPSWESWAEAEHAEAEHAEAAIVPVVKPSSKLRSKPRAVASRQAEADLIAIAAEGGY